jgi:branched-subunit amino acid aminotransferase/4-amino-4-deoxychorismate lyase
VTYSRISYVWLLGVHASDHVKLYVIMSPVGPYFRSGFKPFKLYADTKHVRAWPGGVGNAKVGNKPSSPWLGLIDARRLEVTMEPLFFRLVMHWSSTAVIRWYSFK